MAKISWEELGLEEVCYSCRGHKHDCKGYDRNRDCVCREIVPCDSCDGKGVTLTSAGYEFLEFLVRHQKTIDEIKAEE